VEIRDVNDVRFQGDSTLMGMKIESSYFSDGAFLIETTGARFEYAKGNLKLYQGLDKNNRRLLSTITFDNEPNFIKVEDNNDHIIFWSKDLNIGIYGDSTLIISPKVNQSLKCQGNFKPDYEGRYKGELLLIDDKGGMEIYPQRYEKGYEIDKIELGRTDWIADYKLKAGERVMIAAFPGRPFDWEKSFKSNMTILQSNNDLNGINPYAKMPPDDMFRQWSDYINVIVIWYKILYQNSDYKGPYIVAEKAEFERVLEVCHQSQIKVAAYVSFLEHYRKYHNEKLFYQEIVELSKQFRIDGVYIDGLRFDVGREKNDDKIANWEMIRILRNLFGANGMLVLHGTHGGKPVSTVPNIDTYCDITLYGENVPFKSTDDPYVKYQVGKYGISNAIALWMPGHHPPQITRKDMINTMLEMNGRDFWWGEGGIRTFINGSYKWKTRPGIDFQYYLTRLEKIKRDHSEKQ
jgi:hypothetical protein